MNYGEIKEIQRERIGIKELINFIVVCC